MRKLLISVALLTILVGLLGVTDPAGATPIPFTALLDGAQENPPVQTAATGFASFLLNEARTALTYSATVFGLDFTGSQTPNVAADNLTAAHIHAAPRGVNGPIVFGFIGTPFNETNPNDVVVTAFTTGVGGTVTGKWDQPEGNNTTLDAQLTNLLAGNTYINFHTTQFPGGEIRGQIEVVPEPGTFALMGLGLTGLGIAWRRLRRG
jgi:CHRD domain/PEP-CTERM motif